jgi:hypothetical protein
MKIPWERRTQLGFGENQGKGRGIPSKSKGFSGGALKLPREHLGAAKNEVERKERGLGFEGV